MGPELTLELTQNRPSQTVSPDGPEMASDSLYPDLRYPMVQNEAYYALLLVLLREYASGPRIGYARLVSPRNRLMVIRILEFN